MRNGNAPPRSILGGCGGKAPLLRKIWEFLVIRKGHEEAGRSSQFGVSWNGFAGKLHPPSGPKEGEIPPKATGILTGDAPFPGKCLLFLGKKTPFSEKNPSSQANRSFFHANSSLSKASSSLFQAKPRVGFPGKILLFQKEKKNQKNTQTFPSKMLIFPGKTP